MEDRRYIPSVCPYCGVGCRFFIVVGPDGDLDLEYMPEHPVAGGRLCAKGNAALRILKHPDRLKSPLKKTKSGFESISWEEAIETTAKRFRSIIQTASPDALGFLSSAKCTNEENYQFQKLARMLGSDNVDHCARLCHSPTIVGLNRAFGSGAMTNPLSDLADSDCIFMVGSNPAENHAPTLYWVMKAKDRGAKIIVADPRMTPTAWMADEILRIRPGSDIALLNGIAHVILQEGFLDREFIEHRTNGFDSFRQSLKEYSPEAAGRMTGLSPEKIVRAAGLIGRSNRTAFLYCMGITQHLSGSDNVSACANLALLTGNVGKKGTGVYPLRGQNNVQGACDMGALKGLFPGYAEVGDPKNRAFFANAWGSESLPESPGVTVVEMMHNAFHGKIKGMWIMGEDPVSSDPNAAFVRRALEKLEFLVVQDIFPTETSKLADIILPAAAWAEKSGSFTNTERRVQWFDQAVDPPGLARPDLTIIRDLSETLNCGIGTADPEKVLDEIREMVPSYGGITRKRASLIEGIHWPCPDRNHPGTPILHEKQFATMDGKARFVPVQMHTKGEEINDDFPLVLTTGRQAVHYNSGTMTRRTRELLNQVPECVVRVNPEDASKYQVQEGQGIDIVTARGTLKANAHITDTIRPGIVFLPFHFPGVNDLTSDNLDEKAGIPEYKISACRLEKGERA